MSLIETKMQIGVDTTFSVVHISDTHLAYADMRDGERKVELAESRSRCFPYAENVLRQASKLSKEKNIPIVHTGDLIDFVSVKNIERAKLFCDENDLFMAAGNHEFSLYLGEAKETAEYRNQSLSFVQSAFKNDIRMSSRIINGVNFVVLDNGYYFFEEEQFVFLRNEVEKGLPVILLMHTPLYEKNLYDVMMGHCDCAYLMGVPEELTECYPDDRKEQQFTDALTEKVMEYIAEEKLIKGIIAGHEHINYEGTFAGRIPQVITACEDIRIIEFV